MKKTWKKLVGFVLTLSLALAVTVSANASSGDTDIVNIGVTNSLGGMNPLVIDQTEINVHAMGLQFLTLVEIIRISWFILMKMRHGLMEHL